MKKTIKTLALITATVGVATVVKRVQKNNIKPTLKFGPEGIKIKAKKIFLNGETI